MRSRGGIAKLGLCSAISIYSAVADAAPIPDASLQGGVVHETNSLKTMNSIRLIKNCYHKRTHKWTLGRGGRSNGGVATLLSAATAAAVAAALAYVMLLCFRKVKQYYKKRPIGISIRRLGDPVETDDPICGPSGAEDTAEGEETESYNQYASGLTDGHDIPEDKQGARGGLKRDTVLQGSDLPDNTTPSDSEDTSPSDSNHTASSDSDHTASCASDNRSPSDEVEVHEGSQVDITTVQGSKVADSTTLCDSDDTASTDYDDAASPDELNVHEGSRMRIVAEKGSKNPDHTIPSDFNDRTSAYPDGRDSSNEPEIHYGSENDKFAEHGCAIAEHATRSGFDYRAPPEFDYPTCSDERRLHEGSKSGIPAEQGCAIADNTEQSRPDYMAPSEFNETTDSNKQRVPGELKNVISSEQGCAIADRTDPSDSDDTSSCDSDDTTPCGSDEIVSYNSSHTSISVNECGNTNETKIQCDDIHEAPHNKPSLEAKHELSPEDDDEALYYGCVPPGGSHRPRHVEAQPPPLPPRRPDVSRSEERSGTDNNVGLANAPHDVPVSVHTRVCQDVSAQFDTHYETIHIYYEIQPPIQTERWVTGVLRRVWRANYPFIGGRLTLRGAFGIGYALLVVGSAIGGIGMAVRGRNNHNHPSTGQHNTTAPGIAGGLIAGTPLLFGLLIVAHLFLVDWVLWRRRRPARSNIYHIDGRRH